MKPLSDQTHYEILDLQPDADPDSVERAYRLAQATWEENSLATYSLFDEGEAAAARERVELAYRVLSDDEARDAYDQELGQQVDEDVLDIALGLATENERPVAAAVKPATLGFEDLEDAEQGNFDGARLRRSRLRRGIEIDQIASVTKINPAYLRYLEEERFQDLPAPVYVRGFVTAYARCVGLDPEQVVSDYMGRLSEQPHLSAGFAARRGRRR